MELIWCAFLFASALECQPFPEAHTQIHISSVACEVATHARFQSSSPIFFCFLTHTHTQNTEMHMVGGGRWESLNSLARED